MRASAVLTLCVVAIAGPCNADTGAETWGYRLDEAYPPRQANFCEQRGSALEVADIFERYGPRTGFSALSNAPQCSTRVHAITPRALLRQVRVPLESGGEYIVNFIQVQAEDGSEPVLVTTRRLIED